VVKGQDLGHLAIKQLGPSAKKLILPAGRLAPWGGASLAKTQCFSLGLNQAFLPLAAEAPA